MNSTLQKNRITILLLFAMSIIPFGIAWYLSINTDWVEEGTNNGHLISPVILTSHKDFSGFDEFSQQNLKEIKGRWTLINWVTTNQCEKNCLQALHKSKQLRLMMSKDLVRIRRLVLLTQTPESTKAATWWENDRRLLRAMPTVQLLEKVRRVKANQQLEGSLMIMDPLGNIMMWYAADFDPYDVKEDLAKLLKFSQIG